MKILGCLAVLSGLFFSIPASTQQPILGKKVLEAADSAVSKLVDDLNSGNYIVTEQGCQRSFENSGCSFRAANPKKTWNIKVRTASPKGRDPRDAQPVFVVVLYEPLPLQGLMFTNDRSVCKPEEVCAPPGMLSVRVSAFSTEILGLLPYP